MISNQMPNPFTVINETVPTCWKAHHMLWIELSYSANMWTVVTFWFYFEKYYRREMNLLEFKDKQTNRFIGSGMQ
jgi:hypothetical protein